ncbi:MAG: ABC transporter ATP-binding protein [Lachnospiraceae bacterium]|nr:ABC transporter ATP-binding protein [Lachnospiraceae bacterium]MBR3636726.1 ABC transporter ATP-binding protein [Lachnospiraceae bacterium]
MPRPVKGDINAKPAKLNFKVLGRIIGSVFKAYPAGMVIIILTILMAGAAAVIPDLFIQKIVALIKTFSISGDWAAAQPEALKNVIFLVIIYSIAIIGVLVQSQVGAVVTQGYLNKMRNQMFRKMQNLPIKFFDTHKTGDIMSYYTNDIDTLRQLVSQGLPTLIRCGIIVIGVFIIMLYFSLWMTLVVIGGIVLMTFATKVLSGGSAKYFVRQQQALGREEGFVQEHMNGQKVVKVFNHEQKTIEEFDTLNEQLYSDAFKANAYANALGPIIGNIGNILYVVVAIAGGAMLIMGVKNVSLSDIILPMITGQPGGLPLDISTVIPFLNMTKQFTGNLNQFTQQINMVVMAMAGGERIFEMMDAEPEPDDGYVTLVNAIIDENGNITETKEHTGVWAWKHPHGDGTLTYTKLEGDVRLFDVDFEYEKGHQVLYDVSVYAKPGQKVAFVGATGAGKTTITNLINRFYDIADGKIRYDGININKIKKSDLRRSLGIVLQETNLFTGTVMENIRYGNLDATDEECMNAAALAGADDFIRRLPEGYDTMLTNNGANLSQGQRQLIAIARAAVADPPVMILDEATSSIDTHTEAIVQRGMDKLMEGRTVFVIAHRLSTVKNSNVIMVLDHGHIIEKGNHKELIAEKGTYYQLYTGAFELE